ncbi:MAG: hypothetical protein IJB20_04505 [Clostridia bacterium]|nr:hypothetical protein [Clostridia bacterium]
MSEKIRLSIVTPDGETVSVSCDSVRLDAQDDKNGRNGGGLGIRRGHTPAMIALSEGQLTASAEGSVVLKVKVKNGFAAVAQDVVTVLTDLAEVIE